MTSSAFSQRRTGKSFSDEISGFELFYHLTYMSATAAAGISRSRVFELARQLAVPTARYFEAITDLVQNLRYNYADACRMVGERVKSEDTRTFLLRLSDALKSGEPLAGFLAREAHVQGEHYANEYERSLESLKKWNDGYTAVAVSMALIVIINMVSAMVYDVGTTVMIGMAITAVAIDSGVAWILSRAAPREVKNIPLAKGSKEQRLSRKLLLIFIPLAVIVSIILLLLGMRRAWVLILASLFIAPPGIVSLLADRKITEKDEEVSSFLRSLGGTATSRGTTLADALSSIEIDSFPALEADIKRLTRRLKALNKPELCWRLFGTESGSGLISQATDIFYEAVNLGGDPERAGILASQFAMRTTMLRAKRRGIAATFTWLIIVMHVALAGLMVFLLEIMRVFVEKLDSAMAAIEEGEQAMQAMATSTLAFSTPHIPLFEWMTTGMVLTLAVVNGFAIVASEGSHPAKISFYLSVLLLISGVSFIVVPPIAHLIM